METKMRGCGIQAMQANENRKNHLYSIYISKLLLNKIWKNGLKRKKKNKWTESENLR